MSETNISNINEEEIADATVVADLTEPMPDEASETTAVDETSSDAVEENTTTEAPTDPPTLPSTEELSAELTRLRAELEETKALHARMAAELGEFHALFPEVNVSALPESIWEQVKSGIPLAASYALYEKKCNLHREHAAKINLRNAKKSPGAAGKDTPAEYFSPDEVRAMSQRQVHENYARILASMKTWS